MFDLNPLLFVKLEDDAKLSPMEETRDLQKGEKILGEKFSLGFRFWYGIGGNFGFYELCPNFTFMKLGEQIRIAVSSYEISGKKSTRIRVSNRDSNDPIWRKCLVYEEIYLIRVTMQHISIVRGSFVHFLMSLMAVEFFNYGTDVRSNGELEKN